MPKQSTQPELSVSFQGERGAFSEAAARQLLGDGIRTSPCKSFEGMFEAVAAGSVDCAMAPIENSLAGSVHKNYDLLMDNDLTIVGETFVRIRHNLIGLPGARLEQVRRVYSHPVALAQCERFQREHPEIEAIAAYDTAGSVKMVIQNGNPEEAAIAGAIAAEVYGAAILLEGIEDNDANFTRFLLLTRTDHAASFAHLDEAKGKKTSIVFRVSNKPAALFRALAAFSLRDIDLAKLESRPIEGRPWEYSFYLDLIGDVGELNVQRALSHLGELAESVRVLGSYPIGAK